MGAPPNLQRRLNEVRKVAEQLPGQAAQEMGTLVQEGHDKQRGPQGERLAKVQPYPGNTTGRLDPLQHLGYRAEIIDGVPTVGSTHHAAGILHRGSRRGLLARPLIPGSDGEAVVWIVRILRRARKVLRG